MIKEKKILSNSWSGEISDALLHKLLVEWNQTAVGFPSKACLHQLIDVVGESEPDSVAAIFEKQHITYGDLLKRSNQLANFLIKMGVGPDTLVGLCIERSLEMLIGALGIQKAGGAYVPLDPAFPSSRIEFVLENANAKVLVTEDKRLKILNTESQCVCLDSDWSKISEEKSTAPDSGVKPNNLAYVIYTSGSTGTPKGVQIEHHSVVNFLNSMRRKPGLQKEDILLAVTTLSFDISVLELYLPLTIGAKMVILSDKKMADGPALIRSLDENKITVMQATPASWRLMLESGWEGSPDLKVLCGGEPMPADLAKELIPKCKELWNMYGPTETTIWSTCAQIKESYRVNIGRPIDNTDIYILDDNLQPQPIGIEGELMIGGEGLARGYINQPELTYEKFIRHPFKDGLRIYRTGDLARYLEDGSIECLGRIDDQIKLHGFRIELGEIETRLSEIKGINRAVVSLREDRPGYKRLVAYYKGSQDQAPDILRQSLLVSLPEYMVPSVFVRVESFPLTPNGKLDRKALPPPQQKRPYLAKDFIAPHSPLEKKLAECWCDVLELDKVGIDDSFFDLGGTSLLAARMVTQWQKYDGQEIPLVKVFQHPTISLLCKWLSHKDTDENFVKESELRADKLRAASKKRTAQTPVAIVGMAGRFPGADKLETLWKNLCNGVESITVFDRDELGIGIEEWLRYDPDYVPARGIIEGAEFFDAAFFGISPLEASVMDPQQRVFLELAYEAMENAGYDPDRCVGPVGVYAGIGDNHYYNINLLCHPDIIAQAGKLVVEYGNEKDYIALRVAYSLGLTGPAVSLNTACSTSLLVVDNAIQGLANYDCDLALAGGIDICVPQKSGFLYMEGGTFSKDGHCKPFDADATGTMFCDGAGLVVLKRLDDAIADGDTIYAVVRGSAKNNNGARPASFLAPSPDGQAEVVAMAQARAEIPIETIGYIEAHGTGTPIGDPIEIEALSKVFEAKTQKKQFCYVGSIKGNIGHPTNASGIAGLIKAALVLYNEQIPPTHHFKNPNPKIDFANSPFKVVDKLVPYKRSETPRRTAVSSFGFGGTNVHAILEEAPLPAPTSPSRPLQLISVSAKTASALEAYSQSLASHFVQSDYVSFPDAAYTLIQGRRQLPHRRIVVAGNPSEAAELLKKPNPARSATRHCVHRDPPLVFLFGGQGTQYVNMGLNLYQDEPLFRTIVDECCELFRPHLEQDLHDILYPSSNEQEVAREALQNTCFTQPATFTIQYAIARLWQSIGVEPAMMAGHSIGEFVAATFAGVFELPDALRLVALRGRLMQSMPKGSMLSVRAGADEVAALLPSSIQLAAVNAPSLCVVSGPTEEIIALQNTLEAKEMVCRILHTSHAFHSAMMEPILHPLRQEFENINLKAPDKPFISTVTGLPITDIQACDPEYWVMHARKTVRFSSAINWLLENGHNLFLECGPRATMCTLARQHAVADRPVFAIPSMGSTHEDSAEWEALLMAVGSLWLQGVIIDWDAFYTHEQRRRVPLPAYPFERQRHWVEAVQVDTSRVPSTIKIPLKPLQISVPGQEVRRTAVDVNNQAPGTIQTRKNRIQDQLIEVLAPIWGRDASLLDASATFLEQGFDSLSLTQVAFGIRKKLGVKVNFSQLMKEYPNLDMLTDFIDANIAENVLPEAVSPLEPAPAYMISEDKAPLPEPDINRLERKIDELASKISQLSAMLGNASIADRNYIKSEKLLESTIPQRGIYFSSRLSDSLSATYNESVCITLEGTIDGRKLKNAINRLVERHDALRAFFDETGRLMQIAPVTPLNIEEKDFSHLNQATKDDALQKLLLEETAAPFSFPKGPLFRSKIIFLGHDRAVVVLTGHHTICDGWSLDVLIHDFCAFYSEEISGNKQRLREVSPYADYVRMVAKRSLQEDYKMAREFWEKKFTMGFPALVLPADQQRSGQRKFTARRKEISIDPGTTRSLREVAAKQGWSFFALVLGAYSLLLARISRQHNFVFALPTAEQPVIGQPDLVGHCVNMIPFEVRLEAEESVEAFLARVQKELAESYNYAVYTTTHLLDRLRPVKRTPGITPISAGITSVKKYRSEELPQEGFKADYDINAKSFESFEWYVTALEDGGKLVLRGNYDTGLFNDATVDGWLKGFCEILAEISAQPSRSIFEVARMDPGSDHRAPESLFLLTENNLLPTGTEYLDTPSQQNISIPATHATGSTSAIEANLIKTWQDLLKIRDIGPEDNFFDLGGNSMAAAQLFATLERDLNITLPLSLLFDSPTPRTLAKKIQGQTSQINWQPLVPINSKGSRRPLFLVHGAEGNVLIYRALSLHLGENQPVYGLQSAGLDGTELGEVDFEEVAQRYIKEIQKVQPQGPYLLGGYCLGGTIALEMAHQLQTMGQAVALIAMFENYNIKAIQWPQSTATKLCNGVLNIYYHILNLFAARGGRWTFFMEKMKVEIMRARISGKVAWMKAKRRLGEENDHLHYLKVGDAFDEALTRYEIKPYRGRVALFLAQKSLVGFNAPQGGWADSLKGGLEVYTLPINPRGSMIEPYVKDLALKLQTILAETAELTVNGKSD